MTDALSVAMKAIGVAGDIYLGYSDSKYNTSEKKETNLAPIQDTLSSINTIEELQSFWKENEAEFSKNIQIIKLIEAKKQELKK
jgi:hypothetical protein